MLGTITLYREACDIRKQTHIHTDKLDNRRTAQQRQDDERTRCPSIAPGRRNKDSAPRGAGFTRRRMRADRSGRISGSE